MIIQTFNILSTKEGVQLLTRVISMIKILNIYNHKLLIKNTSRNLFITLTSDQNQVKKVFPLGNLDFPAENLYSSIAVYKLGLFLNMEIRKQKYTQMSLIFYGWNKTIKKLGRKIPRLPTTAPTICKLRPFSFKAIALV